MYPRGARQGAAPPSCPRLPRVGADSLCSLRARSGGSSSSSRRRAEKSLRSSASSLSSSGSSHSASGQRTATTLCARALDPSCLTSCSHPLAQTLGARARRRRRRGPVPRLPPSTHALAVPPETPHTRCAVLDPLSPSAHGADLPGTAEVTFAVVLEMRDDAPPPESKAARAGVRRATPCLPHTMFSPLTLRSTCAARARRVGPSGAEARGGGRRRGPWARAGARRRPELDCGARGRPARGHQRASPFLAPAERRRLMLARRVPPADGHARRGDGAEV